MNITSRQNPLIKQLVKLRDDKRQRQLEKLFLVEGWDEISLAISAGYKAQTLLIAPDLIDQENKFNSNETITVTREVFEKVSYRENPDGWLAIFPAPEKSIVDLKLSEQPLLIVMEAIEKPGNLGAILRTADAVGVDALLICDSRTDIFNPNVVRASRGALFTVPMIELSNSEAFNYLHERGIEIIAATPQANSVYTDQDLKRPVAIIVGTEDKGLSDFWLERADYKVNIPMVGKINSLNVSIATALIAYEAIRQRNN